LDGDTEVYQFYASAFSLEKDVLRFDISVHDVLGMYVRQCFQKLPGDSCCLLQGDLSLGDSFEKFAALAKLHDEHVVVLVIVDLVQFRQVGVVKRLKDSHLIEESLCLLRIHI